MAKIGDIVRFLNSVGGGKITKISGNMAYVEDEDGFETPVLLRECVVVGDAQSAPKTASFVQPKSVEAPAPTPQAPLVEEPLPVEETPEGDKLNVVLAYEPCDLKRLSQTTFDTYLVNDSNYYLYFTYLTREDGSERWTARYSGIVEPNIQLLLGETLRDDLPHMDRVAFQYIAFKQGKDFEAKKPAWIEFALDTTKFAKLHCFRDNVYFDLPVLAFDLIKDDVAFKPVSIKAETVEDSMRRKVKADRQRVRIVKKQPKHERRGEILVVDLHISELVDDLRGLSNADMLNLQVDEFCRVMDQNKNNKGQKIVFIHGKGEGVLRNALLKELNHRYRGNDVQDASFREYGFGATQVTIR